MSATDTTVNYEYIFNLTNSEGNAPEASSLFNIDTLKTLIALGESTVDIMENIDSTVTFNSSWDDLTTTLGFSSNY